MIRLKSFTGPALGLILILLTLGGSASPADAQVPQIVLDIKPSGYSGQYFALEMQPGETREFAVEMGNHGSAPVSARAYPADVYSLINGGFGAHLDGEPTSGSTKWLSFDAQTFDLEPGLALVSTFTVSIPADAAPGDYITSLVLQNAEPAAVSGGGIGITQIQRKAIAVAIVIPGARTPELTIGDVHHKVAAGASFVSFEISNTGNTHLRPGGVLTLFDDDGREVTRFPIALDTVYAGAATLVEVPFDRILLPGDYTASLDLTYDGRSVSSGRVPLEVSDTETNPVPGAPVPVAGDGRATANQPLPAEPAQDSWRILAGGTALGLLLALSFLLASRVRHLRNAKATHPSAGWTNTGDGAK